jgi:hypothetical protein
MMYDRIAANLFIADTKKYGSGRTRPEGHKKAARRAAYSDQI